VADVPLAGAPGEPPVVTPASDAWLGHVRKKDCRQLSCSDCSTTPSAPRAWRSRPYSLLSLSLLSVRPARVEVTRDGWRAVSTAPRGPGCPGAGGWPARAGGHCGGACGGRAPTSNSSPAACCGFARWETPEATRRLGPWLCATPHDPADGVRPSGCETKVTRHRQPG